MIRPWALKFSIALAVVDWFALIACPTALGGADPPGGSSAAVQWPLTYGSLLGACWLLEYFAPKVDDTLLLGLADDPERPARKRDLRFFALALNALILAVPAWGPVFAMLTLLGISSGIGDAAQRSCRPKDHIKDFEAVRTLWPFSAARRLTGITERSRRFRLAPKFAPPTAGC